MTITKDILAAFLTIVFALSGCQQVSNKNVSKIEINPTKTYEKVNVESMVKAPFRK